MPYAREAGHSFAAVLRVSCPLLCLWQVETAGDLPDLGNANLRSLRLHARCGDLLAQAMQILLAPSRARRTPARLLFNSDPTELEVSGHGA